MSSFDLGGGSNHERRRPRGPWRALAGRGVGEHIDSVRVVGAMWFTNEGTNSMADIALGKITYYTGSGIDDPWHRGRA